MGMVSFAMEEGNAEVLKTPEQKELSVFNINDRVRFDENRLEMNGNLHINENNRLEVRVRSYNNVSDGTLRPDRESGNSAGDSTELRMRLHTQTSIENLEIRTELKTNTYASTTGPVLGLDRAGYNRQYFRIQPTYHLFTGVEDLSSLVRVGFGYNHTTESGTSDSTNNYSFTSSFENYFTINDYLAVEGNVYYDYDFAGKGGEKYNGVEIEAYAYANYPLYKAEGLKVEALFEGGMDPYGFGDRHFGGLNNVSKKDTGNEYYTFYLEPSVKATKTLNEHNSAYLQAGYYTENNEKTSSNQYEDTAFIRVGFTSKF